MINTPRREIGTSTLEKLGDYAHERKNSLFICAQEMAFAERVSAKSRQYLEHFTYWLNDLIELNKTEHPANVVKRIVIDINYEDWLMQNSSSPNMAEKRMANVHEAVDWVNKLHADGAGKETLAEIVAHMSLVDLLERNSEELSRMQ